MTGFVMLAALVAIAACVLVVRWHLATRRVRVTEAELADQLAAASRAASEDVTLFTEELDTAQVEVEQRRLDESAARALWRARRACGEARSALDRVARPEDLALVTRTLAEGRFALAYARSRLRGGPRPERCTPCFFNPAHGPSTAEVLWAPAGEDAPRMVPACAADAARVSEGALPNIRTVPVGVERLPYWAAGPAFEAYAEGYQSA
ncbi:hypothetical protein GCM10027418_22140 [Mariniluteicoccus endophyticus]